MRNVVKKNTEVTPLIFEVSGEYAYESNLCEAINDTLNESKNELGYSHYYFARRRLHSLTEEELVVTPNSKYLVKEGNFLRVLPTLHSYEKTFDEMISKGIEFFEVEKISNFHIKETLAENCGVSLTEFINKIPNGGYIAVLRKRKGHEAFRSLEFTKDNCLGALSLLTFNGGTIEYYNKGEYLLSSTMSVARFMEERTSIKYAMMVQKGQLDNWSFYSYEALHKFEMIKLLEDTPRTEFIIKDIVSNKAEPIELPFTLEDYQNVKKELDKVIAILNKDINELVQVEETQVKNDSAISTNPLD